MRRPLARLLALSVLAVAAGGAAAAADARRPSPPTVELGSSALLAPDGSSIATSVVASCAEGSTVVRAAVTVTQGAAAGTGTFEIPCIGPFPRVFPVTVAATSGTFALAAVRADATLVVRRGKTQEASGSASLPLDPAVAVSLGDTATIGGGGAAATIDVTVACPPGPTGLQSYVAVTQGNVTGRGFYVPVCDGAPHTFTVVAETGQGAFSAGDARTLSFADVDWNGSFFTGVADEPLRLVT